MTEPASAEGRPIRICVATSYEATSEPRAPRYAAALARMAPAFEVTFIDCVPRGRQAITPAEFEGVPNIRRQPCYFNWRGNGGIDFVIEKLRQYLARTAFRFGAAARKEGLSTRSISLERALIAQRADIYFGFNIDALLPVYHAAKMFGAPFLFDCQEIYAEMAHKQTEIERAMIRAAQHLCLPACSLVLAASPQAAAFIERDFGILNVLPLFNAAPIQNLPERRDTGEFTLYWRNGTVDLGPRGLDDALRAMQLLPADVKLYLQGRPVEGGKRRVENFIAELGLGERVVMLPPYASEQAVQAAAPYSVGLSLESTARINLDLTASNKFFDYAMAGLAIVSTRTEGLRHLIDDADLGLVYEPGDAAGLAKQIMRLYDDRELLAVMQRNARAYALREGNLEYQLGRFLEAFRQKVYCRPDPAQPSDDGTED